MSNINLGSTFDADIVAAADLIKSLIQGNASYIEVEQAQIKLRELLAAKRSYLYEPKDPSYFIDQMFSAATPEDRRKRAAELEGQVLEVLVNLSKEEPSTQEQEIPAYDLLTDVLEFLRFFKHSPGPEDRDTTPTTVLIWGRKSGITVRDYCQALEVAKFITGENSLLLAATLEDYKAERKQKKPKIDWEVSARIFD
ncbi:MAG: hypothetical protein WCQ50_18865 [Spirochaetota bacterium]